MHSSITSYRGLRWLGIVGLAVLLAAGWMRVTKKDVPDRPISGATLLPIAQELPGRLNLTGGTAWINTSGPINASSLRGKVVLLDFWTFCCINCHHVLPDLAKLEKKYANELVVIGIHSGKFDAEKVTANIREKVREYGIKHPVINDSDQVIWNRYGVESWPTLAVFDTRGQYIGARGGEGNYELFDQVIGKLVAEAKARGDLDESPVDFHLEDDKVKEETPLRFPGKVLADAANDRLFITDTGHNRLVISSATGSVKDVIGSGAAGLKDGPFDQAQFNRPQGLCLLDDILYVADVENHAIRAVDLKAKTVETVAGTGEQSHQRVGNGAAKTTGLNSPWDLVNVPGTKALIVAMAGPHQLWKLDLDKKTIGVWAGNGYEDIVDGPPTSASFAQPSGLATDGKHLYVADSEGSCVRSIPLSGSHHVSTLIGAHDVRGVLFSFGDVDGRGPRARLQHCLGLSYGDGKLYLADTYNNKIKVIDPATATVKSLAGSTQAGSSDSPARFYQPGGLSVGDGALYVADSNNDVIRKIDLASHQVQTLKLDGLKPPTPPRQAPRFPRAAQLKHPKAKVGPGKSLTLSVSLKIPSGLKLNADRPMPYLLEAPGHADLLSADAATGGRVASPSTDFTIDVPLNRELKDGETLDLKLSLATSVCRLGSEGYCKVENYAWIIPVSVAEGGEGQIALTNAK